jgi:hypothetical protein
MQCFERRRTNAPLAIDRALWSFRFASFSSGVIYKGVTSVARVLQVLQGCYKCCKGVTIVLRGCYTGVASVLKGCNKGVTRVLQGLLQGCYTDVAGVLQFQRPCVQTYPLPLLPSRAPSEPSPLPWAWVAAHVRIC